MTPTATGMHLIGPLTWQLGFFTGLILTPCLLLKGNNRNAMSFLLDCGAWLRLVCCQTTTKHAGYRLWISHAACLEFKRGMSGVSTRHVWSFNAACLEFHAACLEFKTRHVWSLLASDSLYIFFLYLSYIKRRRVKTPCFCKKPPIAPRRARRGTCPESLCLAAWPKNFESRAPPLDPARREKPRAHIN